MLDDCAFAEDEHSDAPAIPAIRQKQARTISSLQSNSVRQQFSIAHGPQMAIRISASAREAAAQVTHLLNTARRSGDREKILPASAKAPLSPQDRVAPNATPCGLRKIIDG
jgi:hypothetical protein